MKLMISSSSTATHTLHKYAFTLGSRFGQKKCTVLVLKKGVCVILTRVKIKFGLSVCHSPSAPLSHSYLYTHREICSDQCISCHLSAFDGSLEKIV